MGLKKKRRGDETRLASDSWKTLRAESGNAVAGKLFQARRTMKKKNEETRGRKMVEPREK